MKQRSNKRGFAYSDKFGVACGELAAHPDCSADLAKLVTDIKQTAKRAGWVTSRQAYVIGKEYKRVVNGGRYIAHDWWN